MNSTKLMAAADAAAAIDAFVAGLAPASCLVVTDSDVAETVMPRLADSTVIRESPAVVISAGDASKNIDSLTMVWQALSDNLATRHSLLINIGGGMVTDLGGFAAATFKRGIPYINVPTTLLGAVDAAAGGKTAINFNGLKNEIGAFHAPAATIISAPLFSTLPPLQMLSGYAEMLKTGLICDKGLYDRLQDVERNISDPGLLSGLTMECVEHKLRITEADPTEKGLRKILNFGHTAGHAFESLARSKGKPVEHGIAVAYGMLVELILSHILLSLPSRLIHGYASAILKPHYPPFIFSCDDYPELLRLMAHDKKNRTPLRPDFTLIRAVGDPVIDCERDKETIEAALDICRDLCAT